ncbi:hypothetical protein KUCAC02_031459, partial [Chaenocephalus aceratus]
EELDHIVAVWNHHRIRTSNNPRAPNGRHSIMYAIMALIKLLTTSPDTPSFRPTPLHVQVLKVEDQPRAINAVQPGRSGKDVVPMRRMILDQ